MIHERRVMCSSIISFIPDRRSAHLSHSSPPRHTQALSSPGPSASWSKRRCWLFAPSRMSRSESPSLWARCDQTLDVSFPTTDGRCFTMPRYTKPEADVALLLQQLQLILPK